MNNKRKILWIVFMMMVSFIIFFIAGFDYLSNKNNVNKVSDNKHNEIDENNMSDENKLINQILEYSTSYFNNSENISSPAIFDYFELKFSDTEVEICFEDSCDTSVYEVNNDTLIIYDLDGFSGAYNISYQDDYIILEHIYNSGGKMIYHFEVPKG